MTLRGQPQIHGAGADQAALPLKKAERALYTLVRAAINDEPNSTVFLEPLLYATQQPPTRVF